jgi:pSer/pThr/pTyr-binding forkhead associated (FHA) protein
MVPRLIAIKDGPDLILDKPILLVGRHQECDVQIPSRKISRKHCCIAQVDDHLVVRDLYSTNGVKINGTKVPEGILHHGDELTIGNLLYRVEWQTEPESENHRPSDGIQAKPPLPGPHGSPAGPAPINWEIPSKMPVALDEQSGEPLESDARPIMLPVPEKDNPTKT